MNLAEKSMTAGSRTTVFQRHFRPNFEVRNDPLTVAKRSWTQFVSRLHIRVY
jgi:hypothetical protein